MDLTLSDVIFIMFYALLCIIFLPVLVVECLSKSLGRAGKSY